MTASELNEEIIEKALRALFSIDELAGKIALHGGRALIVHDISHRASQDIDLFVEENTITEHQVSLIKAALSEEFNDSDMEVRAFKSVELPAKTEPKRLEKITANIAKKSSSEKWNQKSPVIRFGNSKGLDIEISFKGNMLHLSEIDSQGVIIAVSSLTRITYEKILSSCENSLSYLQEHPEKGNFNKSLRTKDMFDICSILQARSDVKDQLMTADEIDFFKTLMEESGVVKNDLACFRNDITMYEKQYKEEYESINETLVPVAERIDFESAEATMLDLLKNLMKKL